MHTVPERGVSMHYRERVKEWIGDHDLKQKALAKELGITDSVMSNCLTGRSQMTIEMLVMLAEIFGVSVDYLAGVTNDPAPPLRLDETERQLVEMLRNLHHDQQEAVQNQVQFFQKQNQRR